MSKLHLKHRSKKLIAKKHDKRIKRQDNKEKQARSISPKITFKGYNHEYHYKDIDYAVLREIIFKLNNRMKQYKGKIDIKIKLGGTNYKYSNIPFNLTMEIMNKIKFNRVA